MTEPTREVFVNIAPWMQWIFYAMILLSLGFLAWQVAGRVRLWRQGQPGGFALDWRLWLRRLMVYAVAQKRVHRKSLGAVLHILLFSGFVVLTIGTTLLAIADQGPVNFHHGWYYLFYELIMDVFGVALCVGCGLAFYRRLVNRPRTLGHSPRDWGLLGSLLLLGLTGFAVEALRLHFTEVVPEVARWSLVGHALDVAFLGSMDLDTARQWHLGLWWIHAVLVAVFFACIPVTRFLHVLTGPMNIAARPDRAVGALAPLSMETVEETGRIGVANLNEFSRQQLMSLDACMECGRCEEACPATASGKPLSPKALVVDLRRGMGGDLSQSVHGDLISAETLWACTMCQACVQACPVLIGHVDLVSDLRRHLVGEGQVAGPPGKAMAQMGRQGNPYGRRAQERMDWAAGLDVPSVTDNPASEYLLWVGCAASYDPRAQKIARSLVRVLQAGNVDFAVLGREERCTGDPARRLGDEFLFQEMAQGNVETLNKQGAKKIITPCPHCLNTLKNEYPQFGGHYEVMHHTQFLSQLLKEDRLPVHAENGEPITLHDPCYLARGNGETEAPRAVLRAACGGPHREMARHGKKTFCCGAGGGRMWFEEPVEQRVSHLRAREALATGAGTVATACPFCMNMMSDAAGNLSSEGTLQVKDVAEILCERLESTAAVGNNEGTV